MNRLIARPAELLYRGVNRSRRALYRLGLLRPERLPRPVISVGNRALGGTGKTPTVIAVATGLLELGLRPAVLTRGYGRRSSEQPLLVDGLDALRFGDEPVVIHRSLPEVPVIVGSRRAAAARWFLERGDCDLFLLDDGFQHLQLHRDCDVVIESASSWFREGPSALRDADALLLRDVDSPLPDVPSFRIALEPRDLLVDGASEPLEALEGTSVFAFSGLADNDQFFRTLEALGAELAGTEAFPDHHVYDQEDLQRLRMRAEIAGAEMLVTTAKDAVKTGSLEPAVLRTAVTIEPRLDFLGLLIRRVREAAEFRGAD